MNLNLIKDDFIREIVDELKKVPIEFRVHIETHIDLQKLLAEHLNYLITNNFSLLISVLYRLDISEKKLKTLLNNSVNTPAGEIIAHMIIERQLQKIAARRSFSSKTGNIPEDEKW